jgi:hypothetical protein
MFFIFPLLLVIVTAILFKWLLEVIFRAFARRGANSPTLEERIGAILVLICANVIGVISYWYPWYVVTHYAGSDDRLGGALLFGFPFWFAGAGISAWALFRLGRALFQRKRSFGNVIYGISGVILGVAGFSPLVMLAHRIIIIRQNS